MKKIVSINGMSCNHCVMAVKKALSAVKGIEEIDINLEEGTATVDVKDVCDCTIKEAIEEAGYDVVEIR